MSAKKKSSAPKKHRRGKVRTVTINPAKDDGLGVNIIANADGFVEVAKCHHHSKCKGLKGYCIVGINQQAYGSHSLTKISKALGKLNKSKSKFTVSFVRAIDAGMERLDHSKDPKVQKKKKAAKKATKTTAAKSTGASSKKRKRVAKAPVPFAKFAKVRDANSVMKAKIKELEKALEASNRLQSVMSV